MRTSDFVFNDGTTQTTAAKIFTSNVYDIAGQTAIDVAVPSWTVGIECWISQVNCTGVAPQLNLGANGSFIYTNYSSGGGTHFGNATNQWTANYGFPFRTYSLGNPMAGVIRLRKLWDSGSEQGWAACGSVVSTSGNGGGHIAGTINVGGLVNAIRFCKNGGAVMQSGWIQFIFSSV